MGRGSYQHTGITPWPFVTMTHQLSTSQQSLVKDSTSLKPNSSPPVPKNTCIHYRTHDYEPPNMVWLAPTSTAAIVWLAAPIMWYCSLSVEKILRSTHRLSKVGDLRPKWLQITRQIVAALVKMPKRLRGKTWETDMQALFSSSTVLENTIYAKKMSTEQNSGV